MKAKYKKTQKFDRDEVPDLLAKAKGQPLSGEFRWVEFLQPLEARDELVHRFSRLTSNLVKVCVKGKPNYRSSYEMTFLRLFAGKDVPVENVAIMLKRELEAYSPEELGRVGQLAIMTAIQKTEKNLASTIVICFKDLITDMTKNQNQNKTSSLENFVNTPAREESFEENVVFDLLVDELPEEEWLIVQKVLSGEKKKLPKALAEKLKKHFAYLG